MMKPQTRLILAAVENKGSLSALGLTNSSLKKLGLVKGSEHFFENLKVLTATKVKSIQRRSITTLTNNPIGEKGCLSCIDNQ